MCSCDFVIIPFVIFIFLFVFITLLIHYKTLPGLFCSILEAHTLLENLEKVMKPPITFPLPDEECIEVQTICMTFLRVCNPSQNPRL